MLIELFEQNRDIFADCTSYVDYSEPLVDHWSAFWLRTEPSIDPWGRVLEFAKVMEVQTGLRFSTWDVQQLRHHIHDLGFYQERSIDEAARIRRVYLESKAA